MFFKLKDTRLNLSDCALFGIHSYVFQFQCFLWDSHRLQLRFDGHVDAVDIRLLPEVLCKLNLFLHASSTHEIALEVDSQRKSNQRR